MNLQKFWTITSEHTTHTNDRSTRFADKNAAVSAAKGRLTAGVTTGVYVLESVAYVQLAQPPIEVIEI